MVASSSTFGQHYSYGYGRVGVLQQELMTTQDVESLLSARSEEDLVKSLMELKMSAHVDYTSDAHRFIEGLERWLAHEVRTMAPADRRDIFDILWLKGDSPLLAYLLKRHHGLTSAISAEPMAGATAYEPGDLQALVQEDKPGLLPPELVSFARRVKAMVSISPQEIDTQVAQFVVDQQLALARKSGSKPIELYVAHHIDLLNIRTARRLKERDAPTDHLLRGGEIDIRSFSLDPAQLASLVRGSSLPSAVADAVAFAADTMDSSVELERGLALAIAHDIALMRDYVLSIEPIFAFAAVALSQLKLLRTIIVGKSTHLSAEEIRKLLPPYLSTSPFAS